MSTQITRRIFDVNKDDKNGGLLSSNNHRSNTDIDTKLNCDNARRTFVVSPSKSIRFLNKQGKRSVLMPLSHQTAAVQRFSLTVNAHESAFSRTHRRPFLRERNNAMTQNVYRSAPYSELQQLSRWEKIQILYIMYIFAINSKYFVKYIFWN